MNKQRLLALATELEKPVLPLPFDMRDWYGEGYAFMDELEDGAPVSEDTAKHCGTSACAVGLACLMPEFQKQGLGTTGVTPVVSTIDGEEIANGWGAVIFFFDIDMRNAHYLFDPDYYTTEEDPENITPKMVATRIREVVAADDRKTDDLASEFPDL
jgi:hypothetical protein